MLILSRKVNQSIVINNNIIVTLVEAANGKVRLGIDAPTDIPVFRKEIQDDIVSGKSHTKRKKLS
jgi:carbon storage regulator